ncbi:MAG: family 16 glycoside hydrolase [Bacteroidia bacterium]
MTVRNLLFLISLGMLIACTEPTSTSNARLSQEWEEADFTEWSSTAEGLVSPKTYQNFLLEGEFFLAEGQQSQIVIGAGTGEAFSEGGLTINLDHNPNQQNTLGTIEGVARAIVIEELSTKSWNKIAISVLDKTIELRINEQIIVATQLDQRIEGNIAFKAAQDLVPLKEQFRNLKLKLLANDIAESDADLVATRVQAKKEAVSILADNMDGWHRSGTGSWSLEEGVLTGESGAEGGYLISDTLYKNLYLSTWFKIAKEDNSGIFIRLHPDSSNITAVAGIECNIYDHNGFTHVFSTGSIVGRARAFSHLIDYDDWNQLEILAIDDEVALYVNGVESADHAFPKGMFEEAGHIALQAGIRIFDDGGPSTIQFKEIRFVSLD